MNERETNIINMPVTTTCTREGGEIWKQAYKTTTGNEFYLRIIEWRSLVSSKVYDTARIKMFPQYNPKVI